MIEHPPALLSDDAVFIDFDGTLVEMAATPEQVRIEHGTAAFLAHLNRMLNGALAVISGRPLAQIDRLLRPYKGAAAGIHGLERRSADGRITSTPAPRSLEAVRRILEDFVVDTPGVRLEDKGISLVLHYRSDPTLAPQCHMVAADAVATCGPALMTMHGKMVVEILPLSGNKGKTIETFLNEEPFHGRRPVFVGDDLPDEYGFGVVNALGGISVRVGQCVDTQARFGLAGVADVMKWLGAIHEDESEPKKRFGS